MPFWPRTKHTFWSSHNACTSDPRKMSTAKSDKRDAVRQSPQALRSDTKCRFGIDLTNQHHPAVAGQNTSVKGGFYLFGQKTCERHPASPTTAALPEIQAVRSRITLFEACSAFTHVAAYILAKSPCDPLHRRLRICRYLRPRSYCYPLWKLCRVGLSPTEFPRLFTAH